MNFSQNKKFFILDSSRKSGRHFEKVKDGAKESLAKPKGKHYCKVAINHIDMAVCVERKKHADKYPIIRKECSGCPYFDDLP